jgi:methylthioribose-1-phosphate isomerase
MNTQFPVNILFTDEVGFTRDGTAIFHNTHAWVDDSLHTTMTSQHQHRFSTNMWVGILGDQLLGPVALPNRLTGAVYHCFFGKLFTSTLGTCVSPSTTHVVRTQWGITPSSIQCETEPEPNFQ